MWKGRKQSHLGKSDVAGSHHPTGNRRGPRGPVQVSWQSACVCFGVLCMDLTPLLLLQPWAVRAVCTRDRGRGRAGLSSAAVTALLWPPAAQGGHGPQDSGPLGSMDWGDGSFLTALPFWGFLL